MRKILQTTLFILLALTSVQAVGQVLNVTVTSLNACAGSSNGSITVTVDNTTTTAAPYNYFIFGLTNGSGPFVGSLTKGVPTTISNLPVDNYIVNVSDNSPSVANFNTFVNITDVSPGISFSSAAVVVNNSNCTTPNGTITISPTGGSGAYTYSWTGPGAFSASTQNLTGLAGGSYVVTIGDTNANCTFTSIAIIVTDPLPSAFTITTLDNTLCTGDNLTVNLNAPAPEGGVTYTLEVDGSLTSTFAGASISYPGLAVGSHTIRVKAALGACTPIFNTAPNISVTVSNPATASVLSGTATICSGSSTNLKVAITGGTGPFTVVYSDGSTNSTVNNYASGSNISVSPASTKTYTLVSVTDANGCASSGLSGSAVVTVNQAPTSSVLSGTTTICQGNSANLIVTITGGTGPYKVVYSDGSTNTPVNNYLSGANISVNPASTKTYSLVSVTDANGCLSAGLSGTPTVTVGIPATSSVLNGTATICSGTSTNLKVTITGGTGPFTVVYSDGSTNSTVNNYASGSNISVSPASTKTYTLVSVTDALGCPSAGLSGSAVVTVNQSPTASVLSGTTTVCQGNSANLKVTITGGTGPFTVVYNDGSTNTTVNNYVSGANIPVSPASTKTYSLVSVTDANGCPSAGLSGTATVTVGIPATASVISGTATICSGSSTNLLVTITGGTGPFTVVYSDGSTNSTVNNYASGSNISVSPASTKTFTLVSVTDANGCPSIGLSGSAVVTVNPSATSSVLSGTATICSSTSTNLKVTITGGTGPFTVVYSDGSTNTTVNNYTSGSNISVSPASTTTYSLVSVTDANGCASAGLSGTAVVTVNQAATASVISGTATICRGTSTNLVVTITGGTGPFKVVYTNGVTNTTVNNYSSGANISVSPNVTRTFTLVSVTDANGCASAGLSGSAVVTVHPTATASVLSGTATICSGASTNLKVTITGGTGPFTVVYSDGSTNTTLNNYASGSNILVSPSSTTTYSLVSVTDANGCASSGLSGTAVVTVNQAATASVISGTATICSGSSTNLVVTITGGTGPFTVVYSDGSTNSTVNNYTSGSNISVNPASTKTYTLVSVTDANGCTSAGLSGSAVVTVNSAATASVLSGSATICSGSSTNLVVTITGGTGPFTVVYSDGSTNSTVNNYASGSNISVSPASTKTYTLVSVTDASGCASAGLSGSAVVTVNPSATASVLSGTATICSGSSTNLLVTITGGTAPFTVVYSDGSTNSTVNNYSSGSNISVSPVSNTTYTLVSVTDANGCASAGLSGSAVVTVNTAVTPSVTIAASPGSTICSGTSVTFTATPTNGGATPSYQWTKNGSNVGSNSATYTDAALVNGDQIAVVMTSSVACVTTPTATSSSITMTVTTNVTPSVSVSVNPGSTICVGTSVTFTATSTNGGLTPSYQWTKNGSNVGINSITYTDAALANGDQIAVILTSSITCVTTPTATSSIITMTVNTPVTPSVSISANPGSSICSGTSVTFTATPTNGGATPSYQWTKNGSNVGINSATYTDAALVNGDQIVVVMTSSLTCVTTPTATSSTTTVTVNAPVTATVNISASPNTSICSGTNVTFTAAPGNGGVSPSYQWTKNGSNVGSNSATYADAALANGDQIAVVMSTSLTCVTSPTANSNTITMVVNPTPTIGAGAIPSVCNGTTTSTLPYSTTTGTPDQYSIDWDNAANTAGLADVSITALPASPILISGIPSVASNTTFNGLLYVQNSITGCVSLGDAITVTVNVSSVTPSVSISANPGSTICVGASVTFTASPTNGGATPAYQWTKNGLNVGTNSATYTDASLVNGDQIAVTMTSSLTCVTTPTATSAITTITVTPPVVPSVSIAANPGSTICSGTNVTFTATPINGGATPSYQWTKNGANVGSNSATYSDNGLADTDQIAVVLTTSLTCVTTPTATSNTIVITINALPTITSGSIPSVCSGTSTSTLPYSATTGNPDNYSIDWDNVANTAGLTDVSLTALPATPISISNIPSVVSTTTFNGLLYVQNSTTGCTSPGFAISVTVNALPTITAGSIPAVCTGTTTSTLPYSATTGTPDQYSIDWDAIANGAGLTDVALGALPSSPILISNIPVVASTTTFNGLLYVQNSTTGCTSTGIPVSVTVNTGSVTPTVSISANPGTSICSGSSVTFTASPTNGGASPSYQWTKNGSNVGINSDTYTDASLVNGDQIAVVMTSSLGCVTTATANSGATTITVNSPSAPSVSISANPGTTICAGTSVTFTATPTNGGTTPSYQWTKNGVNVGTNSATYADNSLANGDLIAVVMTSSSTCVTTATASNQVTITLNPPAACGGINCGAFVVTYTESRPTCKGQDDGSITFNVSGGSSNYKFTLFDNSSGYIKQLPGTGTFTFINLSPSLTYQYTIFDNINSNTCTLSYSLPIQTNVQATASGFVDAKCFNQAVGQATVTVTSGGTSPYEYSLDAGASWISFTSPVTIKNLMPAASPYSILVRDDASDLCPAQVSVTITNAVADMVLDASTTDATCANNDGKIQINSVTGGTSPYTYQLDGGTSSTNLSYTGVAGGSHKITVADANGCSKDFSVTINFPGLVNFTLGVLNPTCSGAGGNGAVVATITSSGAFQAGISNDTNPPATWQSVVSAGSSTVTFNSLSKGTYTIYVQDVKALCPSKASIVINGGPDAVDFDFITKGVKCFGDDGGIRLYNFKGSNTVSYSYQIIKSGNIVQSGTITQLQALDTVNINGFDPGSYQIELFQDQSASSGCISPIESAFKSFVLTGPSAALDTLYIHRTISLPDRPTGSILVGIAVTGEAPYQVRLDSVPATGGDYLKVDWTTATQNPQNLNIEFSVSNLYVSAYRVWIRDGLGCTKAFDVEILQDTNLFIPNVFTPNGDNHNDTFYIRNIPDGAAISITNRWGNPVYSTNDYKKNVWNGGAESDGVYYYRLLIGSQVYNGWVEIMRGTK